MTKKLRRSIRSKSTGTIYAKGTVCTLAFLPEGKGLQVTFPDGVTVPTRRFDLFFVPPSMAELEDWTSDGVAESVTGDRVEPDGIGPDGAPSWLIALGMI